MYVQYFSDHQQSLSDPQQFLSYHQQFLSERQQFCADRHPHDNCAGLCFTLCHHNLEWKQFSPQGNAWFSTISQFHVHDRTFQGTV
jgi:hypothetical protein